MTNIKCVPHMDPGLHNVVSIVSMSPERSRFFVVDFVCLNYLSTFLGTAILKRVAVTSPTSPPFPVPVYSNYGTYALYVILVDRIPRKE